MHISCPSCTTTFAVPDHVIGPAGRTLKCARCGHLWHYTPEDSPKDSGDNSGFDATDDDYAEDNLFLIPTRDQENQPDFGSAFSSDMDDQPADDFGARSRDRFRVDPDLDMEEPPLPDFGDRDSDHNIPPDLDLDLSAQTDPTPFVERAEKKGTAGLWIVLLLLLLGAIGAGAYTFQDTVVGWWPKAHDILTDLGLRREKAGAGLELRNAGTPERFVQDNAEILVVRGIVANISDRERKVPPLKLVLLDQDKKPVQQVTQPPPVLSLDPGGTAGFRIMLEKPNATAVEVNVMFEDAP